VHPEGLQSVDSVHPEGPAISRQCAPRGSCDQETVCTLRVLRSVDSVHPEGLQSVDSVHPEGLRSVDSVHPEGPAISRQCAP
jgi:hypothetical protein